MSLKKFFEKHFANPEAKLNGVNEAYEALARTQFKDLIVADLLEKSGADQVTIETDMDKLAYLEGQRKMALYFRNKLELAEKGFKAVEGITNGRTKPTNDKPGNTNI